MDIEKKECTFMWFIENYSYCWHKPGDGLYSPEFTADGLEGTAWSVQVYPTGTNYAHKDSISFYLKRSLLDDGPEKFPIKKYELSILSADGSTLISSTTNEFSLSKGIGYGWPTFLLKDEVLIRRNNEYLPEDTLTVRCKIWTKEGSIQPSTHINARTRIGIEHMSFLQETELFTALKPHQRKTIPIRSASKNGISLSSSLYFSDHSCCDGKIFVEVVPSDANQILAKCKLFLIDESGEKIECYEADNRFDATSRDIKKLPLCLTRQEILNRNNDYLPDGKLTLLCECTFSTGVESEKIESTLHGKPFVTIEQISENDQNTDVYDSEERLAACSSALDDFKATYNNQLFVDVELKTKTKSFPAHKYVLCARSSVFKAMLTNDMKEKNSNYVQVDDLEDETVQQFLLFLYADCIDNLDWESAIKLYYAGDKYAVEKLNVLSSSFLIDNLSVSNASELLLLADTHNDSYLKTAVEVFIFEHEEQVFGSEEWDKFVETNSLLGCKTMLLKYKRKMDICKISEE